MATEGRKRNGGALPYGKGGALLVFERKKKSLLPSPLLEKGDFEQTLSIRQSLPLFEFLRKKRILLTDSAVLSTGGGT